MLWLRTLIKQLECSKKIKLIVSVNSINMMNGWVCNYYSFDNITKHIFFNVFRADTKNHFHESSEQSMDVKVFITITIYTLSPPATNANADVLSGPAQPSILPCVCLPAD